MIRTLFLKPSLSSVAAHWLLCIALFISHLYLPAQAQEIAFKSDQYSLRHYTAETGLPQNSIKSIARDEAGFFWLATEDGLVRFDGRYFHVFNTSNSSLTANRIVQSFRGPADGKLYFLAEPHQSYRISGSEIVKSTPGDRQLSQLNIKTDRPPIRATIAFELSNRHIYNYYWKQSLVPISPGNYFLCDTSGVTMIRRGKQAYRTRKSSETVLDYFTIDQNLYHFDRPNGSIVRVDRNGLHSVTITGDVIENYGGPSQDRPLRSSPSKHAASEILWNTFSRTPLLVRDRKIYSIEPVGPDNFNTRLLLDGFDTDENQIISSFYDQESGLLLLGSHTKGLFVFTRKQFSAFKDSEGFSFHEQSLYKNRYIATNFGAYDIFSRSHSPLPVIDKLKGWAPFATKNGYFLGGRKDTLFAFKQDNLTLAGKWRIGDNTSISYVDLEGDIWLGYRNGRIWKFNMKTFKWTRLRISGLSAAVSFMQQEKSPDPGKHILWIGTNQGLYRLVTPGYRIEKIVNLQNDLIRSLFVRQNGGETEIWGTIFGKGIFLMRKKHFTLFPTDRKKNLTSAHCLIEDKNGFFWVPTNKGLFQISVKDLHDLAAHPGKNMYYQYYDYESGFPTNEFNGGCIPCSIILPNGLLSMPSISGLVYFDPSAIHPQLPRKTLLIDDVEYNGKRITYADTLLLENDFEFLKLTVSTPYFGNPDNVQIDYRLSGGQQKGTWLPVREGGEIVFNGLGSGRYMLSIRKLNGFGTNNYTTRQLAFFISPQWYETWWFKALSAALLIIAAYAFIKWRIAAIKKKNEDLERAVTERTAALKESQNELSRQLNIQAHLIASITHDVRAPLKYVTQASRQIPKLNEMGQYKMLNEVGNALEQSLVQMTNFLDNLLSYVRTTLYHNKVEMAQVDLSELIAQKLILFEKVFLLYSNDVLNEVSPGLTVRSNPELLSVVIHNLIDNASKYARNGQIRIFSSITAQTIHLVIADSGKGIDPEVREWFNNPAAAHSESYGNASPKGFGLVIVKEVARLINLSVFVDNHDGCEFHLVFDPPKPE